MTGGALERALLLACEGGRWELAERLMTELKARREGRDDSAPGMLVDLDRKRGHGNGAA